MAKAFLLIGALYGLLGVMLGAFGTHALHARLSPDLLAVWKAAVEYQFLQPRPSASSRASPSWSSACWRACVTAASMASVSWPRSAARS